MSVPSPPQASQSISNCERVTCLAPQTRHRQTATSLLLLEFFQELGDVAGRVAFLRLARVTAPLAKMRQAWLQSLLAAERLDRRVGDLAESLACADPQPLHQCGKRGRLQDAFEIKRVSFELLHPSALKTHLFKLIRRD